MKHGTITPIIASVAALLAVFAHLRIFGDQTWAAWAGQFVAAALGAAAGVMTWERPWKRGD